MPMAPIRRFTLSFDMGNAAFAEGSSPAPEMARILGLVRDEILDYRYSGKLYDVNGNHIGEFSTEWPEDPEEEPPAPKRRKR